ncbi:hypothetical protein ACFL35_10165 [Candidatus Riflebacteria bacterium]
MKKNNLFQAKKGLAGYVTLMILVSMLFIITQSFVAIMNQEKLLSDVFGEMRKALYLADSGVQLVLANLKSDPYLFTDVEKRFVVVHKTTGTITAKNYLKSDWFKIISDETGEGYFYIKSWNNGTGTYYIKSQGKFVPKDSDGNLHSSSPILKQVWVRVNISTSPRALSLSQYGECNIQICDPITAPASVGSGSFDLGSEEHPFF